MPPECSPSLPDLETPCFLLLRKSRPKQRHRTPEEREAAEQHELARHRSILLHLAEQDGHCIPVHHIITELRSGERLSRRPEFSHWLQRLRAHPPSNGGVLYSMDVDRISRGIASERGLIQETIATAGVKIRTPSGITDLGNPDELLLYEVRGSLARHELQRYKKRVEATKRDMTRLGQLPTGAPAWGYLWDKNTRQPVPDPLRFPVLQSWCRDVLRMSVERLARRDDVYPTLVYRTLRNPMICGYPARRWRAVEGKMMRLPREEWLWPEHAGPYPPACSRAEWEAIQQALTQRFTRLGKDGQDLDGWCRNLVRFEGCPYRPRLGTIWPSRPIYEVDSRKTALHYYIRRDVVHVAVEDALQSVQNRAGAVLGAAVAQQAMLAQTRRELASSASSDDLAKARQELASLMTRWAQADEEEQLALRTAEEAVKRRIVALKRQRPTPPAEPNALLELLLPDLPATLVHWQEEWALDRQGLAEAFLIAAEVRCAPEDGKKRLKREVIGVRWQPWVAGVMNCPIE
jgi:hypothetical protein